MTIFRRSMTALLVCGALAATAATPARASETTKREKLEQMFQMMQIQKTMDQVSAQQVAQARALIANMVPRQNASPEQQKDMNAFVDKILAISHEAINWQKLEPQYLDLYSQAYTEEEIDGILAFYRSPTGQAMLSKQPDLLAKSQAIAQTQVIAMLPQIRAAAIEFAQQMSTKYPK